MIMIVKKKKSNVSILEILFWVTIASIIMPLIILGMGINIDATIWVEEVTPLIIGLFIFLLFCSRYIHKVDNEIKVLKKKWKK